MKVTQFFQEFAVIALVILCFTPAFSQVEEQKSKTKIIIVEEYIDENGEKQTKRIEKEGSDINELREYLDGQLPDGFDIDLFMDEGDANTFIFPDSKSFQWHADLGEKKPYLGVQMEDTDDGVHIIKVMEGSPAQESGLQEGDILLTINGQDVLKSDDVVDIISDMEINDIVDLRYRRDGKKMKSEAVLIEKSVMDLFIPEMQGENFQFHSEDFDVNPFMDKFLFDKKSDKARLGITIMDAEDGVEVVRASPFSKAYQAGIRSGDLIKAFNGKSIKNTEELAELVEGINKEDTVSLTYIRNGLKTTTEIRFSELNPPKPKNLKKL